MRRSFGSATQGRWVMQKTELLFFVTSCSNGWIVHSENQVYGPFISYSAAFDEAVEEAQAAGICGFASAVLAQAVTGGPFDIRWAYGHDAGRPANLH